MSKAAAIHNGILHRLVNAHPHFSDDEKRDLNLALADAAEEIENPRTDAEIQAEKDAIKEQKRAELQAQINSL